MRYRPWFSGAFAAAILTGALHAAVFAQATPPGRIHLEGRLTSATGVPSNGATDIVLRLYDTGPGVGGTLLITDSHTVGGGNAVTVTNGVYTIELGGGTITAGSKATIGACFADLATVYLEMQVGAETLAPRTQMLSAGYALNADALDGRDSTYFAIAPGSGAYVQLAPAAAQTWTNGNVGIYLNETGVGAPLLMRVQTGGIDMLSLSNSGLMSVNDDLQVMGNDLRDSSGNVRLTLGATVSTPAGVSLSVGESTTLGDAAGDALTFNASTLAVPNNLNVDANTLYVDATNNRVGIGTATPSERLVVNGNIRIEGANNIYKDGSQALGLYDGVNLTLSLSSGGNFVYYPFKMMNLGSAGAPVYTFNGDDNTGVFSPGADTLALSTAGTSRLSIASDGTVQVSGALTVGGTTTLNGIFTLGDNGDTGAVNTSDWDISTTGAMTGISGITSDATITLNNAAADLSIMESVGGTFYGTLTVGDLTAGRTYTLPDADGTISLGGITGFATPNLTLGTANVAGVATTVIRSDATILAFDATVPGALGTAAAGTATVAARRDHVHPSINLGTGGGATFSGTLPVGYGGTGTSTAFTQGSAVFAGASGVYTQDNANYFWDDTNNRLGLGTASPSTRLHVLNGITRSESDPATMLAAAMTDENAGVYGKSYSGASAATGHIKGVYGYAYGSSGAWEQDTYGVLGRAYNTASNGRTGDEYGVYGLAEGGTGGDAGNIINAHGVYGNAQAGHAGTSAGTVNYGLRGLANGPAATGAGTVTNYGVYGASTSGNTGYGVYGIASGATTNWAGYFNSRVGITGSTVDPIVLNAGAASTGTIRTAALTAARTWTLPDASGTLALSGSVGPVDATYITQTANATLTAEQALSALATGYMKVTTGTGVVSSQAVPIPAADGGTGQTSYTVGDLLYASAATTLSKLVDVATGSVLVSGGAGVAPAWSTSPTLSGNLTVQGNTTLGDALTDSLTVQAEILNGSALYFEGATNDNVRTTLAITDPTANQIIALPNATGTVALGTGTANYNAYWTGTNALGSEQYVAISRGGTALGTTPTNGQLLIGNGTNYTLATLTGAANQVSVTNGAGSITLGLSYAATLAGNPALNAGESVHASTGIIFEGSAADTLEGLLTVTNPTADRTWTLPDVDGTVITTGNLSSITATGTISSGTWNGTAIGTQYGGTGQNWSAVATGSLPYFSGAGTMSTMAAGTSGYVLTSNGAGVAPTWQANAAAGANTALSNLTATSINQSLVPNADNSLNLGSAALRWANEYLGGNLYLGNINNVLHYGGSGLTGQAAGWDPSAGVNGVWLEGGDAESGGFYADGDIAVIYSPGDPDLLRIFDEDTLPGGPAKVVIDGSGNILPGTDNSISIGNATYRWNGGNFVNLTLGGVTRSSWPGTADFDGTYVNVTGDTMTGNLTMDSDGAGKKIFFAAQDGVNEGGELTLNGAGAYADWNLDNYQGQVRLHTGGSSYLTLATAGLLLGNDLYLREDNSAADPGYPWYRSDGGYAILNSSYGVSGADNYGIMLNWDNSDDISLCQGGGYVSIGPGSGTPYALLEVRGSAPHLCLTNPTLNSVDSGQLIFREGTLDGATFRYDGNADYFYMDTLSVTSALRIPRGSGYLGLAMNPSYTLDVSGTGRASTDFRAPIFYDSSNTAYFIDPNAGGAAINANTNGLVFTGQMENLSTWGMNARAQGVIIIPEGSVTDNGAGTITFGSTVIVMNPASGSWIRVSAGAYALGSWGYLWVNMPPTNARGGTYAPTVSAWADADVAYAGRDRVVLAQRMAGGEIFTRFANPARSSTTGDIDGRYVDVAGDTMTGTLTNNVDVRAPLFYDSDNTGYYVNPAGTSNLNAINTDKPAPASSYANYFYDVSDATGTGYGSTLTATVRAYRNWGSTYSAAVQGWTFGDYARSAGVEGYTLGGAWGSLAYKNSGSTNYGAYYTSVGSGAGFMDANIQTGIGSGGYGGVMGGWVRGEILGFTTAGELYASYNVGDEYTSGLQADIVTLPDKRVAVYSNTSTEVRVYADGISQLTGGACDVTFDASFAEVVSRDGRPTVTVTPIGECSGLCITRLDAGGFSVKETGGGTSNVEFTWIAAAKRIDHAEKPRLPEAISDTGFDDHLKGVMFNENNQDRSAEPIWWDGSRLRFDAAPQKPVDKKEPQ